MLKTTDKIVLNQHNDRSSRKKLKVLFLSQRFLFPMDTGGKIRTGNILRKLKDRVSLTVISNVELLKDDPYLPEMKQLCDKFIGIPWKETERYTLKFYMKLLVQSFSRYPINVLNDYSPELEKAVLDELKTETYDLAICDFLQSTLNFRHVDDSIPTLLFQHNVESDITRRHLDRAQNIIEKVFWGLQHKRMMRHEGEMCRKFDGTIAVSATDKQRMEEYFGATRVYDIPTGVDTDFFKPDPTIPEKPQLVFTGSMDWLPNEDAMLWFVEHILPLIQKQVPETTLVIVGRKPSPALQKLIGKRKDVTITGWVEDTRPYIHQSAVYIVPIRIGGGTRMKIYEALAMGKAMVSTSIGAEGLPLTHEKHLFLADNETDFADYTIKLLKDESLRKQMGQTARQYVYDNFRWEKVAEIFEKICHQVIKNAQKRRLTTQQ
jgi:sugar transferase (PEP-CTERM/EpsH1 system associated)